jgi:hypothetical protein
MDNMRKFVQLIFQHLFYVPYTRLRMISYKLDLGKPLSWNE